MVAHNAAMTVSNILRLRTNDLQQETILYQKSKTNLMRIKYKSTNPAHPTPVHKTRQQTQ